MVALTCGLARVSHLEALADANARVTAEVGVGDEHLASADAVALQAHRVEGRCHLHTNKKKTEAIELRG